MEKMMVRAPVLIHLVRPFVLTLFPHQLPQAKFDITGQGTILDADKSARPAAPVLRTPPVRTAAPMEGVADDLLTRSSRKRCLPLDSPRPPQRCMNVTLTRLLRHRPHWPHSPHAPHTSHPPHPPHSPRLLRPPTGVHFLPLPSAHWPAVLQSAAKSMRHATATQESE